MNRISVDVGALFRLDSQVAVVTGAGAGIGRCIAVFIAAAGAQVVAVDLDRAAAESTSGHITQAGGKAEAVRADIAAPEGAVMAVEAAMRAFGRLDVLVNNAGIYPPGLRLPEIDWSAYERTYAVNVFGTLRCMSEAARRMQPGGRIINISSMESLRPSGPGNAHYSSTKASLNAMTRAAAVDFAPLGIRVNAILPGLVKTEGTGRVPQEFFDHIAARAPSGRAGLPDDIAGAALFLASAASSYVNGQCLVVDGGMTIAG
jgi:NAD(P)-dependent dehydrogenase (short-subunit alcohol dehydrogenase family)